MRLARERRFELSNILTIAGLFLALTSPSLGHSRSDHGYVWKKCERPELEGITIPFDKDGKFLPECAPDTLYSWKSRAALDSILANMTPDNLYPMDGGNYYSGVYLWRTPLGTFGYGDTLLRFKLKSNVKFAEVDRGSRDCNLQKFVDETVYVIHLRDSVALDYLICSPKVIASWSFGRPEILEEMTAELEWTTEHDTKDFDRYAKSKRGVPGSSLVKAIPVDGKDFSQEALERNFANIVASIKKNEGKIFFAQDLDADPLTHFSTRRPNYFNHRPSNEPQFSRANVSKRATRALYRQSVIRAISLQRGEFKSDVAVRPEPSLEGETVWLASVYPSSSTYSPCRYRIYFGGPRSKAIPLTPSRIETIDGSCDKGHENK